MAKKATPSVKGSAAACQYSRQNLAHHSARHRSEQSHQRFPKIAEHRSRSGPIGRSVNLFWQEGRNFSSRVP